MIFQKKMYEEDMKRIEEMDEDEIEALYGA